MNPDSDRQTDQELSFRLPSATLNQEILITRYLQNRMASLKNDLADIDQKDSRLIESDLRSLHPASYSIVALDEFLDIAEKIGFSSDQALAEFALSHLRQNPSGSARPATRSGRREVSW